MSPRYMMTAFGRDRVGIVADVTRILYENECNLEDTTMNILSDEFSMNLLFSSKSENIEEQIGGECRRLEMEKGISAFVRKVSDSPVSSEKSYRECTLHIEGLDQSGMVYKTSQSLSNSKINILHLASSVKPSPQSGALLYDMNIHVQVPAEMTMEQVEEELSAVADELQVDITITE